MNPKTTTLNEAQSINAAGHYRHLINASLTNVAEMSHGDGRYSHVDAEAAKAMRDRNTTVFAVESVAEAEALVAACQYALAGRYADHDQTTAAIRRVQYEAARFDRGVRLSTHRERDRDHGVDRGDGVATDGGTTTDDDVTADDHTAARASSIIVEVNDEVLPPADIVAAVEDDSCHHGLRTGRDDSSVTMTVFTHGFSRADVPDGWVMSYATNGRRLPEGVPERASVGVVLRPER